MFAVGVRLSVELKVKLAVLPVIGCPLMTGWVGGVVSTVNV